MKTAGIILLTLVVTFCLYGQSQRPTVVLTSVDVKKHSVRVTTQPNDQWQNLVFDYVGKTSLEVETIVKTKPHCVQIMKNGVVITQTDGGCSGHLDSSTNYVGLTLVFSKYDQAKLAEKTLRGD